MVKNLNLIKLSLVLLVFNLLLVGLAIFNFFQTNAEIAEVERETATHESVLGASSDVPKFNKNYIMSDDTFRSTRAFPTEQSVQNFLDRVNSPLRNYTEGGYRASYWIYSASRGVTSSKWGITPQINPGVILAYLEKENSLLSLSNYDTYNDPERRIRKAMGYGCPDTASCDTQYYGFANQVNWASYQLQYNYQLSQSSTPDAYKVNKTIATLDEYNVFLTNPATAANYRYTPHVYWGNYNLWKIIVANGWGVDTRTWSYADIDAVNLANKDQPIDIGDLPNITRAEIDPILRKVYKFTDYGEDIKKLQTFLRQEGYYMTREINGRYGTITQDAHVKYRQDYGILGNYTTMSEARCTDLINRNWSIGTENQDVVDLQQCLRELGMFNWPRNTGYFGPVTNSALEAVRRALQNGEVTSPAPGETCEDLKNAQWSIGERSQRVKKLQECMQAVGTFNWPYGATGYFGPVTQKALDDWKAMDGGSGSNTGETCEDLKNAQWSIGERSQRVKKLQECMQAVGTFNWPYGATGYFGPVTQKALDDWKGQSSGGGGGDRCESLKNRSFSIGEVSQDVRDLQGCMRSAGYFTWPYGDTGYYGPVTKEAHAKYKGQDPNVNYSCSDLKGQVWVEGETSERVRSLQKCMQDAGTFRWKYGATGYFGPVTKDALIKWRGYF